LALLIVLIKRKEEGVRIYKRKKDQRRSHIVNGKSIPHYREKGICKEKETMNAREREGTRIKMRASRFRYVIIRRKTLE